MQVRERSALEYPDAEAHQVRRRDWNVGQDIEHLLLKIVVLIEYHNCVALKINVDMSCRN